MRYKLTIEKKMTDPEGSKEQKSNENEKKILFRPTPFPMAPRLGPPKWLIEEDDDNNENDGQP